MIGCHYLDDTKFEESVAVNRKYLIFQVLRIIFWKHANTFEGEYPLWFLIVLDNIFVARVFIFTFLPVSIFL